MGVAHPGDDDDGKGEGHGPWDATCESATSLGYSREQDTHLRAFLMRQRREEKLVREYHAAHDSVDAVAAAAQDLHDRSLETFSAGSDEMRMCSKRAGYEYAARAYERHREVLQQGHVAKSNSSLLGIGVFDMQKWSVKLAKLKVLWSDLIVPPDEQQAFTKRFTKRITPANVAVVLREIEALEADRMLIKNLNESIKGRDAALGKLKYLLGHEEDYSAQHFKQSLLNAVGVFTLATAEAVVAMHAAREVVSKRGTWGTCRTYFLTVQHDARRLAKEPLLRAHLPYPIPGNPLLRDTRRVVRAGNPAPSPISGSEARPMGSRQKLLANAMHNSAGTSVGAAPAADSTTPAASSVSHPFHSVDEGGDFVDEMSHGCNGVDAQADQTNVSNRGRGGNTPAARLDSSHGSASATASAVAAATASPLVADFDTESADLGASRQSTYVGGVDATSSGPVGNAPAANRSTGRMSVTFVEADAPPSPPRSPDSPTKSLPSTLPAAAATTPVVARTLHAQQQLGVGGSAAVDLSNTTPVTLRRRPWTAGATRPSPLTPPAPTLQCCTPPVCLRRKGHLVPQLVGKPGAVWKKKGGGGGSGSGKKLALRVSMSSSSAGSSGLPSRGSFRGRGHVYGEGTTLPAIVFEAEDLLRRAGAEARDTTQCLNTTYDQIRADALEDHINKPVVFLQKIFRGFLARKHVEVVKEAKLKAETTPDEILGSKTMESAHPAPTPYRMPLNPLASKGPNAPRFAPYDSYPEGLGRSFAGGKAGRAAQMLPGVRFPRDVHGLKECYAERLYWAALQKHAAGAVASRAQRLSIRRHPAGHMAMRYAVDHGRGAPSIMGIRGKALFRRILTGPVHRTVLPKQRPHGSRGYEKRQTRLQARLACISDEMREAYEQQKKRVAAQAVERVKKRVRDAIKGKEDALYSGLAETLYPLPGVGTRAIDPLTLAPARRHRAADVDGPTWGVLDDPSEGDWVYSKWFLPPPFKRGIHPCCVTLVAVVALATSQLVLIQHERQRATRLQAMASQAPGLTASQGLSVADMRRNSVRRSSFRRLGAMTMREPGGGAVGSMGDVGRSVDDSPGLPLGGGGLQREQSSTATLGLSPHQSPATMSPALSIRTIPEPRVVKPQHASRAPRSTPGFAFAANMDVACGGVRCKDIGAAPTPADVDRMILRVLRGSPRQPQVERLAGWLRVGVRGGDGDLLVGLYTHLLRRVLYREDIRGLLPPEEPWATESVAESAASEPAVDRRPSASINRHRSSMSERDIMRQMQMMRRASKRNSSLGRAVLAHRAGRAVAKPITSDGSATPLSPKRRGAARSGRSSPSPSPQNKVSSPASLLSPSSVATPASRVQSRPSEASQTPNSERLQHLGFQECGNDHTWNWVGSAPSNRKPATASLYRGRHAVQEPFLKGPGTVVWAHPWAGVHTPRPKPTVSLPLWSGVAKTSRVRRMYWNCNVNLVRRSVADYRERYCYRPSRARERRWAAAITIQCAWRVCVARQTYKQRCRERQILLNRLQAEKERVEEQQAAVCIQRWWRGIVGQRYARRNKVRHRRAVATISRWWWHIKYDPLWCVSRTTAEVRQSGAGGALQSEEISFMLSPPPASI